jgi:acetyl-CoA acetyltransferase
MRDVYLVGAARTDYGAFPDESCRSLFETAFENAVATVDGEFTRSEIDEAYVGTSAWADVSSASAAQP